MSDVTYQKPTARDVTFLIENLRESDRGELRASDKTPREAIETGIRAPGWVTVTLYKGVPVNIWGVAEVSGAFGGYGSPWMLGTPDLDKHRKRFWAESKRIVDAMAHDYRYLINHVWAGSEDSVAYLSKLGFQIEAPEVSAPKGELFHRFSMGW